MGPYNLDKSDLIFPRGLGKEMEKVHRFVALTLIVSACAGPIRSSEGEPSVARSPSSPSPLMRDASDSIAEDCGEIAELPQMKFCITKTMRSSSTDVLYFLHLGNGDEHQWKRSFADIQAELEKRFEAPPVVITVSFGPFWLLVEKNQMAESGLFEAFRDQVLPIMENRAIGHRAARRYLMGASMGGFNAAELLLKLPRGTFEKAVVACPALLDLSPWASSDETKSFVRRTKGNLQTINNTAIIAKSFVPDYLTWTQNVNPLDLIKSAVPEKVIFPPTLIAGNVEDHTFFEGARKLFERAKGRGLSVVWQRWPGGHCQIDAEAVGNFLKTK